MAPFGCGFLDLSTEFRTKVKPPIAGYLSVAEPRPRNSLRVYSGPLALFFFRGAMKYVLRILLFLSLISTYSTAQSRSTNRMSHPHQVNAQFSQMTDQFVKDSLALSPVSASQAGYHKHLDPKTGKTIDLDAQLDDVSAQGISAQEKFYREW